MISSVYDYTEIAMNVMPGIPRKEVCPYCRQGLVGCDCGYGLTRLENRQTAPRRGLKELFLSLLGIKS